MNVLQLAQLYSFQNDTKLQKLYYTDHPKAAEYAYKPNKLNSLTTNIKIFSDFRENSISDSLIKKTKLLHQLFPSCGYQEIYIFF